MRDLRTRIERLESRRRTAPTRRVIWLTTDWAALTDEDRDAEHAGGPVILLPPNGRDDRIEPMLG